MKYLIINTESFQKGEVPEVVQEYINKHEDPFIILDESTKIKSNKAVSKASKKSKRTLAIQTLNNFGHRAILTGTFISKSPVNAYDQMEFLKANYFGEDMYAFERRYCIMVRLPIGRVPKTLISEDLYMRIRRSLVKAKKSSAEDLETMLDYYGSNFGTTERKLLWILKHKEYTPFMNLKDLYDRIKDDVMIVKKKDALDLPPKVYEEIKLFLPKEAVMLYKQIENMGFTDDMVLKNSNGISLYHRLQDVCNGYIPKQEDVDDPESPIYLDRQKKNTKIDALLEKLNGINTDEYQVVVWSNRKLFLQDIYEALTKEGYVCCKYDGDAPPKRKEEIREGFSKGKIRVFIGNQKSGAFGLDFLKNADYEIFMSNDYSAETREQAEDRLHRGGITTTKNIIDIVIRGSVDEKVTSALKLGKELIHSGETDKTVFALEESLYGKEIL